MIPARPDLLVIGALTVDRFADGTSTPGGSVLHAARAVAVGGASLAVVTTAGRERDAIAGVDELRRLATSLAVTPSPTTATFIHIHDDAADSRRLRVPTPGGQIVVTAADPLPPARALLLAPVLEELLDLDFGRLRGPWTRGAILQGWLRILDHDGTVRPRSLSAMPVHLVAELAGFDLLVASREDLAADGGEPSDQMDALRLRIGEGPVLVVTDGAAGAWFDVARGSGATRDRLPVPRTVEGVTTVGAGDVLAASLLLGPTWPRPVTADFVRGRLQRAMGIVAGVLEERLARR